MEIQNEFARDILINAFQDVSFIKTIQGMTVVDFGCGASSAYKDISRLIGESGRYIGIDDSEKQIEFNKAHFQGMEYIVGNENSKEAWQVLYSADIIYMRFVVIHQKNQKGFLRTLYDDRKPVSFLIIQEPDYDQEKKKFVAQRYPFAVEIPEFKGMLGKKRGVDYNFAPHIKPFFETLKYQKLIHNTNHMELPMPQAKAFFKAAFKEVNSKDPVNFDEESLAHYLDIVSMLPENDNEKWPIDLMHTIIVQK
ncbi:MAG: methyltransferase domain-containing protein [Alphaproteobacteria bacterium]|nr:class I SAM-dependent methyltransferase [Candidatus Jidaibacter sp.]